MVINLAEPNDTEQWENVPSFQDSEGARIPTKIVPPDI
jgi:hypothetical protein